MPIDARTTTALFDDVQTIDNKAKGVSPETLFDEIDRDRDGTISKEEFSKMYHVVKDVVGKAHDAEKALEGDLQRSKRRMKVMCVVLTLAITMIAVLLAGNASLGFVIMQVTKEVHTNGTALTNNDGKEISTISAGKVTSSVPLGELASLGDGFPYNTVEEVSFPLENGRVVGFRTIGFQWFNMTDMDLILTNGLTLHLSQGTMALAATQPFGTANQLARRRELFVCAGACIAAAVFVGSSVGSAVIGYHVNMALDHMYSRTRGGGGGGDYALERTTARDAGGSRGRRL